MVTLSPCQIAEATGSIWAERGLPSPISYLLAGLDPGCFHLVALPCNVMMFLFF